MTGTPTLPLAPRRRAGLLRMRTDPQLVARLRAGDDAAFDVIHERYGARLVAYVRGLLGGRRAEAEDVVQDVFLRAYRTVLADNRPVQLRPWLYRVAHNRAMDVLRRPSPLAADPADAGQGVLADPHVEAERREDVRQLVADLRRLPEQQRSALLMRELGGLSHDEVARALETTVPAVKSLLVRARLGLTESAEARATACVDVQRDLAERHDRGVRIGARAQRHLRDCADCRAFRERQRRVDRGLAALLPVGALPLAAAAAKALGLG
ncbi:MAG: sigma-70 family RNA polymerase sigma factor, partial [Actinomycetota bacterium]|nr:sigma-70 family RNA polymerase sigma factor [Actinomycetota bacterium]